MSAPIKVKMSFLTVRVFYDLSHKTVLPAANIMFKRTLHCSATNEATVNKRKGGTRVNRILDKMMAKGGKR